MSRGWVCGISAFITGCWGWPSKAPTTLRHQASLFRATPMFLRSRPRRRPLRGRTAKAVMARRHAVPEAEGVIELEPLDAALFLGVLLGRHGGWRIRSEARVGRQAGA